MAALEESETIVTCTLDEDVDVLNEYFDLTSAAVLEQPAKEAAGTEDTKDESGAPIKTEGTIQPLTYEPVDADKKSTEKAAVLRYRNTGGNFFTGIDTQSEEASRRRAERARRFGVEPSDQEGEEEEELGRRQARATRFGTKLVAVQGETAKLLSELPQVPADAELRPEAVYLHGTDDMSTADVFAYFRVYAPRNIEWINDSSCNIVWDDSDSAHRALKGLGRQPVAMRESFIDDQDAMPVDSSVTEWRLGQPHAKARQLLLRHATTADKKLLGAAQQSQYYYKYGNPNAVHHKAAQNKTQQSDLRDRLDRKRSPELMEVELDSCVEQEGSLPAKRPRPSLHSDQLGAEGTAGEGDLRTALTMKKKKQKELKMRLGQRVVTKS